MRRDIGSGANPANPAAEDADAAQIRLGSDLDQSLDRGQAADSLPLRIEEVDGGPGEEVLVDTLSRIVKRMWERRHA